MPLKDIFSHMLCNYVFIFNKNICKPFTHVGCKAQLSGRQKQRVAIARALAMRPMIMLFDDVTSALDPELVGEVLNVLRTLAHEREMTMLIVTHEIGFAREIADRVVFMEEGRVVEDDVPEVIFSTPRQERTRAFLKAVLHA